MADPTEGKTILCFLPGGEYFQGRLITDDNEQYGLTGRKANLPEGHFHECCFEDTPAFFTITVIDFMTKKEIPILDVMRTGGDNCSLVKDEEFEFHTDQLFTDSKADEIILKYFNPSLVKKDCLVCTGHCIISVNLS